LQAIRSGANPDASGQSLPPGLRRAVDLRRAGVFGGGWSTGLMSLQLAQDDPRVDAAFVGDTGVSVPDQASGLRLPWLPPVQVNRPAFVMRPALASEDPMWDAQWRKLRGWRRETALVNAGEFSFLDFQWVLPQIQSGLDLPADRFTGFIGTIDPRESLATQHAYLAAFFGEHLLARDSPLLDGPSAHFPAVRFTRR
jgi:hypothetical protein